MPGYGWTLVERGVSKLTHSCWYDRAGYGWSDPSPGPHAAVDVAEDLHKLLHSANVPPPYLLVGHSVGGFNTQSLRCALPRRGGWLGAHRLCR